MGPQVDPTRRAEQRAHAQRMDRRVPARLVHDQVEVVVGPDLRRRVALPAQLGGLALQRAQRHRVELVEQAVGQRGVERPGVAPQHPVGQHGQGIPGVQGEAQAVLGRQRGPTPPALAPVDDVVVDQEGVVQHLDGGRRTERVLGRTAEGLAGREAQSRADGFAGPAR
jgi:hypothetical protein